MSAFRTSPTRGDTSATTSTARLTTAITSSHSPSMLVNIELSSYGSPDSRTTRTAAATASDTLPVSSVAVGEMLKATITGTTLVVDREVLRLEAGDELPQPGQPVPSLGLHGADRDPQLHRGLVLGQVLVVAQHDDRALSRRQRQQRLAQAQPAVDVQCLRDPLGHGVHVLLAP